MFRICKAELKKLFLKPSIFVVTGLLIVVLALCSFIYTPNNRDADLVKLNATNVSDSYNYLNSNAGTFTFNSYDQFLVKAKDLVDEYSTESNAIEELLTKIDKLANSYEKVRTAKIAYETSQAPAYLTQLEERYNQLELDFKNFLTYYQEIVGVDSSNRLTAEKIHILTTSSLHLSTQSFIQKCIKAFELAKSSSNKYDYIIQQVGQNYKFKDTLITYVNQLIPFIPDAEYVATLEKYITQVEKRLGIQRDGITYVEDLTANGLYQKIDRFVDEVKVLPESNNSKANLEKLQILATRYKEDCQNAYNFIWNSIKTNGLYQYSGYDFTKFLGFEQFNYYETSENQVKLQYLLDNGAYSIDYANNLSMDQPSNYTENAYDFSFFAMRLCLFIVVIYVVTVSATTIVGEQASGTMKLLAIRPYKRSKILGGKFLSILLIGTILTVVSAIATLLIGGITYGFASAPVLLVFNASKVLVVSPFAVFILMILTLLSQIVVYALLALAISLLFKSQVASVAISILTYFGTLALNVILGSSAVAKFLPFTHIDRFKYFGGSFISTHAGFLQSALYSPVSVGSNYILSIIYTAVIVIALAVLVFEVFKKRDIR